MRIAFLSDIHGNSIALDAVLADIETLGDVDATWVLGDLVAIGSDPIGALERLEALPNTTFVRGNTDRYTTDGSRPRPWEADVRADPSLLARFGEVQRSFAWTQGMVTAAGWFDWLSALPLDARMVLPDGTRLLGVHASPGTDDGHGVHPGQSDDERSRQSPAARLISSSSGTRTGRPAGMPPASRWFRSAASAIRSRRT